MALIPFAEAVAIALFSPVYFSPMFAAPPSIVGISLGFALTALILGWAGLGAGVVWTTKSPVLATLALTATTAPAIVLQLIAPALILILQNLHV